VPTAVPSYVLQATAVHDDAMLARLTSVLGVHHVGAFSYDPDPATGVALARVEVLGDARQQLRVLQRLRRVVGVLEVTEL